MVRFVRNSPPQALKIVKLRRFYVVVILKNANVTLFRKIICENPLKKNFAVLWEQAKIAIIKNNFD
jgi:hypothetical protein